MMSTVRLLTFYHDCKYCNVRSEEVLPMRRDILQTNVCIAVRHGAHIDDGELICVYVSCLCLSFRLLTVPALAVYIDSL